MAFTPTAKKMIYDATEAVNTIPFRCIVPTYALDDYNSLDDDDELNAFFERDPNETSITTLTISHMVDYLANGTAFEICNNEDVEVVISTLKDYQTEIESLKLRNDVVNDLVAKCNLLDNELMNCLRKIDPKAHAKISGVRDHSLSDLFKMFQ